MTRAAPRRAAHALLLVAYMVPVVYLAEQFGLPINDMIVTLHAPVALGGVIIAALVATPEAHRRGAIGAGQSAAAFHEHLPRLLAGHDRADNPFDAGGQPRLG